MALYLKRSYQLDPAKTANDGDDGKHSINKGGL